MEKEDWEILLASISLTPLRNPKQTSKTGVFGEISDESRLRNVSADYLHGLLRFSKIEQSMRLGDLRLRIALHFSPPEAVSYDRRRTEQRWKIIFENVRAVFEIPRELAEKIARLCAVTLDDWDTQRRHGLVDYRSKLLALQGNRCACCILPINSERVELEGTRAWISQDDPFKPYFDGSGVDEFMAPQVDHISAVSRDGRNSIDNLQVLCALCNYGKKDDSGIRPQNEYRYCHMSPRDIPFSHRASLLYYRIFMDDFSCTKCGNQEKELTIRPLRSTGVITLTNMRTVCYGCA